MPSLVPSWNRVAVFAVVLAFGGVSRGEEAGEAAAGISLSGLRLGDVVSGPALATESLEHRVVVLEFWGVNCPPCIRSMPALEALHRQLGPAGLVVIGAHAQQATPAEIKDVVSDLGVTFTIVERATVTGAMDFTGIPHCMVFDHTGTCIYRGHPSKAHDAVVAAVRSSPASVLEGRVLVKLATLSNQLRDEGAFATVLGKAQGLARSADRVTADEATYIVEKLQAYGSRLLESAKAAAADDPVLAMHLAQRCARGFRGTEIGGDAAALLRAWKQDKAFQASLRAAVLCRQLEVTRSEVVEAAGNPEEITPELTARLPDRVRRQMKDTVALIQRLNPGSSWATRAEEIATEFGLAPAP